jgi:AraC-like DNA-binding protein
VALIGEVKAECPFRGHGRRVGLDEIGSILRLRDRGRFDVALRQLDEGIRSTNELDDARGSALTFLAVVSAALLEIGHSQKLHAFQLQAARRLDQLATLEEIADYAADCVHQLTEEVIPESRNPNDILIDRAIQVLERHYSADVTDTAIADRLGVSTSHFRHLFKQRTGQPFHKFLISMRLEQARLAILQTDRAQASKISKLVRVRGKERSGISDNLKQDALGSCWNRLSRLRRGVLRRACANRCRHSGAGGSLAHRGRPAGRASRRLSLESCEILSRLQE